MQDIIDEISKRFDVLRVHEQRADLWSVWLRPEQAVPALTWMEAHTGFVTLTHMSAVDWIEEGHFQLTWLVTEPGKRSLMVCADIDRDEATVDSVHRIWPQAVTYEQEMNEMFGISFPGSPRQGVNFCLEGWDGPPPMRRDFDTVAFVQERFFERPGRTTEDTKDYVGRRSGQKGYLHD